VQADVSPAKFELGLDVLAELLGNADEDASSCFQAFLDGIQSGLPKSMHKLLHLHLASRHYSARSEAFHQLYRSHANQHGVEDGCALALVDGKPIVANGQLREAIAAAQSTKAQRKRQRGGPEDVIPIDHVIHLADHSSPPVVMLYGAPGTRQFHDANKVIREILIEGNLEFTFVMRPVITDKCISEEHSNQLGASLSCLPIGLDRPVYLAGYGVELHIKDTEYNQVRAVAAAYWVACALMHVPPHMSGQC
jgi:hypothetical protein